MSFKRILLRLFIVLLSAFIVLLVLTFTYFWRSPPFYTEVNGAVIHGLLSKKEYQTGHPVPYIVRTNNVIVFGARHTKDPQDQQIQQIEAEWKSFKPTVTLVEGRLGFLAPGLMDPVKNYGEMGKVNELAKKDHVPVYSWELPKETAVTKLLSIHKYTPEQIALYQILLPYFSNYRFGKPENPDRFVEEYLSRGKLPGLENTIVSVADIDRIWKRDFGREKDWRDTSDEFGLPGYLQEIFYDYSDIRDQHLAALIKHFQEKNEKVFAITGSSHAVIVEKAIQ